MKLNAILLYTFLLCGNLGFTQNLPAFKQYSIKGLAPKSDISAVYQDKEGFLWFSGLSGLYKYDGNILTRFQHDPRDSTSLPHNYIVDFCEDSSGNFVCSSLGGGIFIMNKRTGKCTRPAAMKQLAESGEGGISHFVTHSLFSPVIWCGTSSGTLIKFDERTSHFERVFLVSPNSNASGDKAIVDVLELQEYKLLIASYRGLYYFDAIARQSAALSSINRELKKLDSSEIYSLLRDNSDRIWIGYKGGVMIVDTHLNLLASLTQQVNQNLTSVVNAMAQLKDGKVLLGTSNGVFYWDDGTKELKSMAADDHSFEHSPKEVNLIYTDMAGNVWIATATQGLFLLNKNYRFFKKIAALKKMMSSSKLQAIMEDASGNWWIGGDSGLVCYKRNTEKAEVIQLGKSKKTVVYSIFQDAKGGVWIGTMADGLYYVPDPDKSFTKRHFNKILIDQKPDVVNFITSVNEDRFGNIWIGTFFNGVFIYDPVVNKFSHYGDLHNAPGDKKRAAISQIIRDSHGDIWVSTWSNGFNKFIPNKDEPSKGEFINYTNITANANSLSFPITSGIKEDKNGNFWIGTVSGGLNKFDPAKKQFTRFSIDNGLPSNLIYHIEEDKRGNIWFSTDEGLSMLPDKSSQFVSFKEEDGLPTRSFTFLSSCSMRDGTVAFGTIDGDIVYFQPEEMEKNTQTPAIVDFKLFNRSLSLGEDVIFNKPVHLADTFYLKHDQSVFTFEFSNFDFINPDSYTYGYKLEGVDKDWNYISNRKSATYTNLSPGKYTFRLKAANHLGVWSDKEIIKSVIVSPPWWLTWWAYISYAALIVAALWTFIYVRSRRLIKEKKRLEHQVNIRTAEVVQQKEEIATQRDNLEHALHDLKSTQAQLIQSEKMASLGELTAGIAHEIQNPLNFVNNFSEVNKELLDDMKDEIDKGNLDEAKSIANDVIENQEKINHHGKRADAIVKGMLQHSKASTGKKELNDINKLADEYLRLAYHGFRAKDKSFNAQFETDFDPSIEKINIVPQDIGRVILNLINNAFYAVNQKTKQNIPGYEPAVTVATKKAGDKVLISVADNGNGIPKRISDKIFQPFFTTKPAGQGTGLGLSLSYDIIKAHGGEIKVETKEGEGSEFIIQLLA